MRDTNASPICSVAVKSKTVVVVSFVIIAVMNDAGYVLYDLHEHAFEKSGLSLAFASIESLTPFAGIDIRPLAKLSIAIKITNTSN